MKPIIPPAILTQHTAILGKTGRGKTTTAKLCVEQVTKEDARVCILDLIKSDWWGLTSSADGKRPGLPFHILGGPRGHVPLHSRAGGAIAELVASGELRHSIIDMADFEPGGAARFFTDFAPVLLRKMKGVVYLVIEEAHEIAPKERVGFEKENMGVYWAKKLATAGRSKGIRLIVLTQRVQALHNAVLGSCDTMIIHGMTQPADQEQVVKWMKANVHEKELRERVERSLSSLPTGTGWICSGEAQIFERVAFPKAHTYDNTATPDDDSALLDVKTAAVDAEKLRSVIGTVIAEAEANDPKMLRKRIADLEQQVRTGSKTDVDAAYKSGYDTGHMHGVSTGESSAFRQFQALREAAISALKSQRDQLISSMVTAAWPELPAWQDSKEPLQHAPQVQRTRPSVQSTRPAEQPPAASSNGSLSPSARKIVDVIHRSYPVSLSFDAAARRAVISSKSSAYRKYRAEVEACHELESLSGKFRSRPEFANGTPIDTRASLAEWIGKLPPTYGSMLRAIHEHGPIGKDEVADLANVSRTSSGLGSGLRELMRLQLIAESGGMYEVEEGLR